MHLIISIVVTLGSVLVSATRRFDGNATSKSGNIIPGIYLVEFENDHDNVSFYNGLYGSGIEAAPRMLLNSSVFRGASFKINGLGREITHASMISTMPAVKSLWPLRNYSIPELQHKNTMANPHGHIFTAEEDATTADNFSTHVMTQVNQLQAKGYTGAGIRIGIVDTGVDYMHPALGGCFGKDCLIEYGYDLVGDDWTGLNNPIPDDDPYDDCIGHGTHVSGIIGAQPNPMNVTGVAPGAKLGMYKVFSCLGSGTTDDVLIAAFTMAFEDGSDIITSSVGGSGGWNELPWSVVASRIVDQGVPCTLAAGNDGQMGLFSGSTAADGKGVTAVASFDNIMTPMLVPKAHYIAAAAGSTRTKNETAQPTFFGWVPGAPFSFENISLPLRALSNDSSILADACMPFPDGTADLSGWAVLIRVGGCELATKARNAMDRRANYILFYSDGKQGAIELELDMVSKGYMYDGPNATGWVSARQGAAWVDMLNNGSEVELIFVDPKVADTVFMQIPNNVTGGFSSSFTSWGPTWDMNVYPTIAAPGGNILSTYLLSEGGYAIESGTSMATPFVAAVYALVAQTRRIIGSATELEGLVSSTAKASLWNDGAGVLRELAPATQQGAGLVQAHDAAFSTTLLSVKSISFNDSAHSSGPVNFTIENLGLDTITYHIGHVPSIGMYVFNDIAGDETPAYFPNPIFAAPADMAFSQGTVSLQPKHRAIISVTALPPTAENALFKENLLPVYSGSVVINGSDGSSLKIPYVGLAGSLYDAVNVDLANSQSLFCDDDESETGDCRTGNATFTVPHPTAGLDPQDAYTCFECPTVYVNLNLGTALIKVDATPLSQNQTIDTAGLATATTSSLGHTAAGSIYGYPLAYESRRDIVAAWNGMLADGTVVPAGRYTLAVSVLKLFGNPDRADDYSTLPPVAFELTYYNASSSVAASSQGIVVGKRLRLATHDVGVATEAA